MPNYQSLVVGIIKPPSRGDALWMIVNGDPALRYFVEFHDTGCRVAFAADLKQVYFADSCHFFADEITALLWLVDGDVSRMESALDDSKKHLRRIGQLHQAAIETK